VADFTIDSYIRRAWLTGERDPEVIAERALKLILASDDAYWLLLPLLREAAQARIRTLTRALEKDVTFPKPRQAAAGRRPSRALILDQRSRLMDEFRWVPGKGNVKYRDLTIEDLDACIGWMRDLRSGIQESIGWLEAARRAMQHAGVSTLGELDDLPSGAP
jgi:hypothetical protein